MMPRIIEILLLSIVLIFMSALDMSGQSINTVTIEDQILISPNKFTIKIRCVTSKILNEQRMEGEHYISHDSVIQILNSHDLVEIVNHPRDSTDSATNEYLNVLYAEITGINTYQELKNNLEYKTLFSVEEYYVDSFEHYKSKLLDKMIDQARLIATEDLLKYGKEMGKMLNFKVVEELTNETEINSSDIKSSNFSVLKEKFIQPTFKGHLINAKGQIIFKKKIQVNFEIK